MVKKDRGLKKLCKHFVQFTFFFIILYFTTFPEHKK